MIDAAFNLNVEGLDALVGALDNRADDLCEATAIELRNGMQIAMSGPKSGRFYGSHQASAPSEAPAVMTGALKNNISIEKSGEAERIVSANQEYAVFLELGTRYMEARPFMAPEVMRIRPKFIDKAGRLFDAV